MKVRTAIGFFGLILLAGGEAHAALISYWAAEGDAIDSVGPNSGTLVNGVTFAPGFIGQGFSFDGTSYVQAPTIGMPTGNQDRTINLWFRINSYAEPPFEEAFLAVEIEKRYTKDQILTLYLNLVNLGHGNYGMKAAARYFFNKPVGELTLPEAATLAAIVKSPSRYSPYDRPDLVRARRDRVLEKMLDEGYITRAEHDAAAAAPLLVVSHAPRNRLARAITMPCSVVISAPSVWRPLMCKSMGRAPMAHPPGSDTRASPHLATSGPRINVDARMVRTSSQGASAFSIPAARIVSRPPPSLAGTLHAFGPSSISAPKVVSN